MPEKKAKKKGGRSSEKLTPKQRSLVSLMPLVESGKMTMTDAMKRAGYSDSSARQQQSVLGHLKNNSAMREALEKVGVTDDMLAGKIKAGMDLPPGKAQLGYVNTALELKDSFPAKKNLHGIVDPEQLLDQVENSGTIAPWGGVHEVK